MKGVLAVLLVGFILGACTIATFGGPKCSTATVNRAIAVVCR